MCSSPFGSCFLSVSVQEKLEILNDRLDQVTGMDKGIDADDGMDGAQSLKQSVKKCESITLKLQNSLHAFLCWI